MPQPLAIDLYCGLGGWTEGFLAEGYRVIGYDIERHDYGTGGYPGELVLRDVRSIHGADLVREYGIPAIIVGSSPCQEFSYRAMPWKRAKALPPPYLGMELFQAQFRIQREASEAAGRYIPLIVENVRGAQKWVGQAKWHFGSYYLWGDVPALMPMTFSAIKNPEGTNWRENGCNEENRMVPSGVKVGNTHDVGSNFSWNLNEEFQAQRREHVKVPGISFSGHGSPDYKPKDGAARHGSKSNSRKAASAMIAKIPFPLAQHIARSFKETW